jgi:molybdenum cofactor biosynthesis enzyme MoaA
MLTSDTGIQPLTANQSFCVLPWLHVSSTVDGVIGRCCVDLSIFYDDYYRCAVKPQMCLNEEAVGCTSMSTYAQDNPEKVVTFRSAFHGSQMRRTRAAMLTGARLDVCRLCYDQEALGRSSLRQTSNRRFNQLFNWEDLLQRTSSQGQVDYSPLSLDLRLGNQCNLHCLMCSYPTSHTWRQHAGNVWQRLPIDPYSSDHRFWNELRELSSGLEYLYFAGGEPLLQTSSFRVLQLLREQAASSHTTLTYSSNLTVLPKLFLDIWKCFRAVHICASCDGYGKVFESIRRGASWDRFARNVSIAKQHAKVTLDVTVQRDNVTTLDDLWAWAVDTGVDITMSNILQFPTELRIEELDSVELAGCLGKYVERSTHYRNQGRLAVAREIEGLCKVLALTLKRRKIRR